MNPISFLFIPFGFGKKVWSQGECSHRFYLVFSIALPIVTVLLSWHGSFVVPNTSYGFLVSVFSVFSAFLFAAQIAAFSIFSSVKEGFKDYVETEKDSVADDVIGSAALVGNEVDAEKSLSEGFRLVNASISYLVLLSVLVLAILIVFELIGISGRLSGYALVFLIVHFFAVLFYAVGKTHDVFDEGYDEYPTKK